MIRHWKLPRVILAWTSSPEQLGHLLKALDESVLWCDQLYELGAFRHDTKLLFVVEEEGSDAR